MSGVKYVSLLLSVALATSADAQDSGTAVGNAWGENISWTNWRPEGLPPVEQVIVTNTYLAGFVWAENVGWINLGNGSPANAVQYANLTGEDLGVNLDPETGELFGLAWGESVGWINFAAGAATDPPNPVRHHSAIAA